MEIALAMFLSTRPPTLHALSFATKDLIFTVQSTEHVRLIINGMVLWPHAKASYLFSYSLIDLFKNFLKLPWWKECYNNLKEDCKKQNGIAILHSICLMRQAWGEKRMNKKNTKIYFSWVEQDLKYKVLLLLYISQLMWWYILYWSREVRAVS